MDLAPLIEKLRANFHDIEQEMALPDFYADRETAEATTREHQRLAGLLKAYDELTDCRRRLAENNEMLADEDDEEFREVIEADSDSLEQTVRRLDTRVLNLVLPPEPNDSRNTIMEIRPAAGGDEAALFAAELFRMYSRFAEAQGWRTELLELTESDLGGIKDVSFSIAGDNVFKTLQYESGVHRVQRVPTTETSGRIHTSTVTVAVLPEAEEIEIEIASEDLRMDVFRSQGPGGQSVNTTDSAVRITHLPTGLSVASQQEKSQHRNRETAMRILRSRLLEIKQQEEAAKYANQRKSQVGTGDRSERIRTYNFPQNRVTDHRYNLSWYSLPTILEGQLSDIFEDIIAVASARRLEDVLAEVG